MMKGARIMPVFTTNVTPVRPTPYIENDTQDAVVRVSN